MNCDPYEELAKMEWAYKTRILLGGCEEEWCFADENKECHDTMFSI